MNIGRLIIIAKLLYGGLAFVFTFFILWLLEVGFIYITLISILISYIVMKNIE